MSWYRSALGRELSGPHDRAALGSRSPDQGDCRIVAFRGTGVRTAASGRGGASAPRIHPLRESKASSHLGTRGRPARRANCGASYNRLRQVR
jgi:hypothetical protein